MTATKKELVFDFDALKYSIGSALEKRDILVQHPSGIEEVFKTRTDFHGNWRKKEGGWLAEYNKGRDVILLSDEFTITDRQHPEPVEFAFNRVKQTIYKICEKLDIPTYYGYIGRGDSFRVERSTILKYKGNRTNALKPIHLPAIEEYLLNHHDAKVVTHLEADDQLVMDCWKNPDRTMVMIDKDFYGVNHLNLYNTNTSELVKTGNGLGHLLSTKTGIKGIGRKFFYHQILSGDSSDNYFANCASDIKWAEKSSYDALKDCNTDRECIETLVECYKKLYPKPKVIEGWRGDKIEINWLYVLEENFDLARMLRYVGDDTSFVEVANILEVELE